MCFLSQVNYKNVMKQYNLGPNGGILTSLNLFATRFDQVCCSSRPSWPYILTHAELFLFVNFRMGTRLVSCTIRRDCSRKEECSSSHLQTISCKQPVPSIICAAWWCTSWVFYRILPIDQSHNCLIQQHNVDGKSVCGAGDTAL